MSWNLDLRIALRSLARTPGFLITAVLSLGLGLGAGASAFSVIDAVRLRSLPFKDADRLVLLSEVPVPDVPGAKAPAPDACRSACGVVSENLFSLLGVRQ